MANTEVVKIRIEPANPTGTDLLPDVLRQLRAMTQLLTDFAEDERYSKVEVVSLDKHSPLYGELRVVYIENKTRSVRGRTVREKVVRRSPKAYRRLERAYGAIRGTTRPRRLDPEGFTAIGDFARTLKGDVATITTDKGEMVIDSSILPQIESKLGPVYRSVGTFTGVMQSVNIHSEPWSFTIYPEIGPRRLRCTFKEELYPQVHSALGKMVRVHGLKEFTSEAPWPIRMIAQEVTALEPAPEGSWLSLLDEIEAIAERSERLSGVLRG